MTEFIGCPWCTIGTHGCRCAAACGAEQCDHAFVTIPAVMEMGDHQ